MVGNTPAVARDRAMVEAIYRRVNQDTGRFLWTDPAGGEVVYSPFSLALLVAEIVAEHTVDLQAQFDVAEGFIEQLECSLRAAETRAADAGRGDR